MNESYVLKEKNGAVRGYVMARNGRVRVRLPVGEGTARVFLLYDDGSRSFERKLDGTETEHAKEGRLLGAYVCAEGKLLMETGEAARSAFEQAQRRILPARTTRKEERRRETENQREWKRESIKTETAERRWPPPPCMPGAKYVNGAWRISEEAAR